MRNSREENLSEHSMEVAMIAHALCIIANTRFDRNLNADRAAVVGIYHDASEIITGDMPTPVKYYSEDIRDAYKKVEAVAEYKLLNKLPDDMREPYERVFFAGEESDDIYMRRLVKAADKLSALIKCIEEEKSGNTEFATAKESTLKTLIAMREELPAQRIMKLLRTHPGRFGKIIDWHARHGFRTSILQSALAFLAPYETIVTTRLHGAIFGLLTGKKVVLLDNSYGKNGHLFETWLSDCDEIAFHRPERSQRP